MEIVNTLDRPGGDIKEPLRLLAASADRLQALRGRLLLELALHLEECPGPRVLAHVLLGELHLFGGRPSGVAVQVCVDWPDYGRLRDGLPLAHYRVRVRRPGVALTEEWRPRDAEQACRHILKALTERL